MPNSFTGIDLIGTGEVEEVWGSEGSVMDTALINSSIHSPSVTDSDFCIQKAKSVKGLWVHVNRRENLMSA
jgi:hypothetical protein